MYSNVAGGEERRKKVVEAISKDHQATTVDGLKHPTTGENLEAIIGPTGELQSHIVVYHDRTPGGSTGAAKRMGDGITEGNVAKVD